MFLKGFLYLYSAVASDSPSNFDSCGVHPSYDLGFLAIGSVGLSAMLNQDEHSCFLTH